MIDTETTTKQAKSCMRDFAAGLIGILAAGAVMLAGLRFQDFTGTLYPAFALFVFPVPLACGLMVGLVSTRKSVMWGLLWVCIAAAAVFALLVGAVHSAGLSSSPWRLAVGVLGVALAAASSLAARRAAERAYSRRVVVAFVIACGGMGLIHHSLLSQAAAHFEQTVKPHVLSALDQDYILTPRGLEWNCTLRPDLGCYELSTTLNKKRLSVYSVPSLPSVSGIGYKMSGGSASIVGDKAAYTYLTGAGFRHGILRTLSPTGSGWTAGIESTRLTLSPRGEISLTPYPAFSQRTPASHPVRR